MQLVIQVISSQSHSLRNRIVNDKKLKDYDLYVVEKKKVGRPHGWAKLHSVAENRDGAINIKWSGRAKMLLCRIVTKGSGRPDRITGDFVYYLLSRYRKAIVAINIVPR